MLSSYILGTWIGSCVFIVISTVLLVLDGKAFVQSRNREENPSYEADSQQIAGQNNRKAPKDEQKESVMPYIISAVVCIGILAIILIIVL